jgi:hypothetical protein
VSKSQKNSKPDTEAPVESLVDDLPEAPDEPETVVPEPELSAEEKAAADAEIEAGIQARFDESQAAEGQDEQDSDEVVIINLQANPVKAMGLASYGEATLTAAQLNDPRFVAKLRRAVDLGLIKVK